jgi:calcineurin-like phosphoesterase family protein
MERWYVSDHHLGHFNVIKYGQRPFSSLEEMEAVLLENHNKLVHPSDHVSFLGDVSIRRGGRVQQNDFIKEIKKYNGHKRLYLGNHDHFQCSTYLEVFEKVYATWRSEEGFICSHFPLHPTSLGSATACVHGHIHRNASPLPVVYIDKKTQKVGIKPYINVCVEVQEFRPISLGELLDKIRKVKDDNGSGT